MYYDPFELKLGISNEELLVDGAIIAENPSMYAAVQAMLLDGQQNVRVISIGSGTANFDGFSFTTGNFVGEVLSSANLVFECFNGIKANAHTYFTKILVGEENFFRFNFTVDAAKNNDIIEVNGAKMPVYK